MLAYGHHGYRPRLILLPMQVLVAVCQDLLGYALKNPKRTESGFRHGGRAHPPSTVRGLCRQTRFTLEMLDGHESNALSIPVWKIGVCLSTPMPEEKLKWKPENPVSAPVL